MARLYPPFVAVRFRTTQEANCDFRLPILCVTSAVEGRLFNELYAPSFKHENNESTLFSCLEFLNNAKASVLFLLTLHQNNGFQSQALVIHSGVELVNKSPSIV
ncbi:hypothetical protein TNIN_355321 [Trichonephila inaurata madagascariensis]|uniref:Uncharacterized protein n=1 Tax=Trichonephila inaurata madagascariensis TaxID=2747483 RepID=A0A8X6XR11_9ARAC|nr:hypothetical protein TNIN_355321 [Trichonephila inaurata madagascariensis]